MLYHSRSPLSCFRAYPFTERITYMRKILETMRCIVREMDTSDWKDLAEILQDPQAMYAYAHAFSEQEVDDWPKLPA